MNELHVWTREDDTFILNNFGKIGFSEMGRRLGDGMTRHQIRGRYWRLVEGEREWVKKTPASHHKPDVHRLFLTDLHCHGLTIPESAIAAGNSLEKVETSDSLNLTSKSTTIKSIEDLVAYAKIDLTKWKCVRQVVNKWEVGAVIDKLIVVKPLFQVKAWFEPVGFDDNPAAIRKALVRELNLHSPHIPAIKPRPRLNSEFMAAELFIPDPHHGKLCWGPETGSNYDSSISERIYSEAVDVLMARTAGLNIDQIIFPIGNDFFHTDTPENTTTAGTPQDVDGRWQKTFRRMRLMLVKKIQQLRAIAPVRIIIVPGNHDQTKIYYAGDALECFFHNTPDVTVDNLPCLRKYHPYGVSLIGYAHGDKERLLNYPMLMAHEAKQQFAQAKYYEWHLGHFHKRMENKRAIADQVNTDTIDGAVLRRTPSLGGTDAWHFGKGYVHSPRQADLFLWGRESGPVGYYTHHYWGATEKFAA